MNTTGLLPSEITYIAQVNTLGHAIVIETLKMAAYYLNHSNGLSSYLHYPKNFRSEMNEAKSCYLFVQGSGLEVTLNRFDLSYNADRIRTLFNYLVRHSI